MRNVRKSVTIIWELIRSKRVKKKNKRERERERERDWLIDWLIIYFGFITSVDCGARRRKKKTGYYSQKKLKMRLIQGQGRPWFESWVTWKSQISMKLWGKNLMRGSETDFNREWKKVRNKKLNKI